ISDQDKHIQDLQYRNKQSIESKEAQIEKEETGKKQYEEDIKDLEKEITTLRDKILDESDITASNGTSVVLASGAAA
mgnify:CR=1